MGIKFFKKNIYDLSNTIPVTTVTDAIATSTGEDYTILMRNRDNRSGWATTDSTDAANTTLEIDFVDIREFDSILILGHNLKAFTLQYWTGSIWTDFSTPINETTNIDTSNYYSFTKVFSSKLKLVITGTQVANDDKLIRQFIVTELYGEFTVEPRVRPIVDRDRVSTKYLSGKTNVSKAIGGFVCEIKLDSVSNENDLALVELIFDSYEGVLTWLCGGDDTQFETQRIGWRLEDIYLMQPTNEYHPEWQDGFYKHGMPILLKMVEVN